MKRQPIPQFELPFASEPFALVAEKQSAPVARPQIMAEMTEAEREQTRQQSKERLPTDPIFGAVAKAVRDSQDTATMPGLAPGSSWSMAKALSTMQRGTA